MANAGPNTNGSQFFIVTAHECAVARRQAHRLRPGHRAGWTSSTRSPPSRPTARRADRARRAARPSNSPDAGRGPERAGDIRPCAAQACRLTPRQNRTGEPRWRASSRRPRAGRREHQRARGIPVENPATGKVIATVPDLSADEVRAMAEKARRVQPGWEALGFEGRGRVLLRAQKWLIDNRERVIETVMSETGKTYEDAQLAEFSYGASALGFWAKNAEKYLGDEKVKSAQPLRQGQEADLALPAARPDRRDRPVELPADELLRRLHPGAGRRQRGDPQAERDHAAHGAADGARCSRSAASPTASSRSPPAAARPAPR